MRLSKRFPIFTFISVFLLIAGCSSGGSDGAPAPTDDGTDTVQAELLLIAIAWSGDSQLSFDITSPSGKLFIFGDPAKSEICSQRDDQEILNPDTGQRVVECPVADLEPGEYTVRVRNTIGTSTYNVFVQQGTNEVKIADAVLIFNSIGAESHNFQLGDELDVGGVFTNPAPASAAVPALSVIDIKLLAFEWTDVVNATFYRLLENPDGVSGFSQVGEDVASGGQSMILPDVPLIARINASYILQSCNDAGCIDSSAINIGNAAADAVGYFKVDTGNPSTTNDMKSGRAISISGDGRTLAISTPGLGFGTVHVYSKNNVVIETIWSLHTTFVNPVNADTGFGSAVSLNDDGSILAVSARSENSGNGAVYIYEQDLSTFSVPPVWSQTAKVTAESAGSANDIFGGAISLSGDGNRLAIGAAGDDNDWTGINPPSINDNRANSGAVYIYNRNANSTWSRWSIIKASNAGINDLFGSSVSLDTDGTTLAVGATSESSNSASNESDDSLGGAGAVYTFTYNVTNLTWSQQQYLKASTPKASQEFGGRVNLSGDGRTLVVGASTSVNNPGPGEVYVLTSNGINWTHQVLFAASAFDQFGNFGWSVDISGDGNYIAVGSFDTIRYNGAVDVYKRDTGGSSWSHLTKLLPPNPNPDVSNFSGVLFGDTVSLSDNGDKLAIGSSFDNGDQQGIGVIKALTLNNNAINTGAVYLY